MKKLVLLIGLIVLAVSAAPAQANFDVFGSVKDPKNDYVNPYAPVKVRPGDIAEYGIRYGSAIGFPDSFGTDTGQVTVSMRFFNYPVGTGPATDYSYSSKLARWDPVAKTCNSQAADTATIEVSGSPDAPIDYDTAVITIEGVAYRQAVYFPTGDASWVNGTKYHKVWLPQLANRGYNCVTDIVLHGGGIDTAKRFCMSQEGTIACDKLK